MTTAKETYLGDGLYVCSVDEGSIRLRYTRGGYADHVVFLDGESLEAFLHWLRDLLRTASAAGQPQ